MIQSVPRSVHYIDAAPIRLHCHMRVDVHHGETNRVRSCIYRYPVPRLFG